MVPLGNCGLDRYRLFQGISVVNVGYKEIQNILEKSYVLETHCKPIVLLFFYRCPSVYITGMLSH